MSNRLLSLVLMTMVATARLASQTPPAVANSVEECPDLSTAVTQRDSTLTNQWAIVVVLSLNGPLVDKRAYSFSAQKPAECSARLLRLVGNGGDELRTDNNIATISQNEDPLGNESSLRWFGGKGDTLTIYVLSDAGAPRIAIDEVVRRSRISQDLYSFVGVATQIAGKTGGVNTLSRFSLTKRQYVLKQARANVKVVVSLPTSGRLEAAASSPAVSQEWT